MLARLNLAMMLVAFATIAAPAAVSAASSGAVMAQEARSAIDGPLLVADAKPKPRPKPRPRPTGSSSMASLHAQALAC